MGRAASEGALAAQVGEWVSAVTFDDLPQGDSPNCSATVSSLPSAQLLPERDSNLSRPAQIIPSVLRSTKKPE